jgi:hypothetical protein
MFQFARRAGLNAAQLLTAFSFFRLRGADLWFFQYVYPTVISAVIFVSYQMLEGEFFAVQLTSIVSSATTLMGVLVGFYIAALAAVTSFPNESLNSIMAGNAPKILERSTGQRMPVTRRRFLAILLGYCAFLSIFVYAIGSIYSSVGFLPTVNDHVRAVVAATWWLFYVWISSSLLVVTMLCLHYLIDRMHRA